MKSPAAASRPDLRDDAVHPRPQPKQREHGEDLHTLLGFADRAMYQAKANRDHRFEYYSPADTPQQCRAGR